MKYSVLLICISLCISTPGKTQDKWDLRRLVEYAITNNISVKQSDINARIAELTLKQSRLQQWPNANFSNSTGINAGRSIDPTTNLYTNQQLLFSQFSLNGSVTVFNFFNLKNTKEANEFAAEAARVDVEKIKNDISLLVSQSYLIVLVSQEQANIANVAVQQTLQNLENTPKG